MYQVLRNGETLFSGTREACIAYAKDWGILKWVDLYQEWVLVGDSAII